MRRAGSLNLSWIFFHRPGAPKTSGKERAAAAASYRRRTMVPLLLAGGVLLSACSSAQASSQVAPPTTKVVSGEASQQAVSPTAEAVENQSSLPALLPTAVVDLPQGPLPQDLLRSDSQGAVQVDVIPVDLTGVGGETLTFDVSMNTHSVNLSMDLAALSTLQTDTGVTLAALDWSGGSGHHVRGTLRFPAVAPDGSPALQGASSLTLTIRDLDASERVFEWSLLSAQ